MSNVSDIPESVETTGGGLWGVFGRSLWDVASGFFLGVIEACARYLLEAE